jgi:hypothetical protein
MNGFGKVMAIAAGALVIIGLLPLAAQAESDNLAEAPEAAALVPTEPGAWRTRIQSVFDAQKRELSRRVYTVWDSSPSSNFEFVWVPDRPATDKPGRINGSGRLLWRAADKADYDRSAVFATYTGTLRNGRMEGQGIYIDRTGLHYEGQWRDGVMWGLGRLKLPIGDEYVGYFRAGKADGIGRYVDVTGEIYDGPFVAGRRQGRATTTLPNGRRYASLWRDGKETERSRWTRVAQSSGTILPGSADDVRIAVLVDKTFRGSVRQAEQGDLLYDGTNTVHGLVIKPADQRLISTWKGGGDIQLTREEEMNQLSGDESGVLSKSKEQIVPLQLAIEVRNRSSSSVTTTGVYLDVRRSVTDAQPAIQLTVGPLDTCGERPLYRPKFRLENFGWGAAEDAVVHFDFTNPAARSRAVSLPRSLNLGRIDRTADVDLGPLLDSGGVNTAFLSRNAEKGVSCNKPKTLQTCLNDLKANGVFGSFNDKLTLSEGFVLIGATGRLEYSWRDASGTSRRAASPFTAVMPVTFLRQEVECGEGGGREPITTVAQQLRLDAVNYRVPVSFQTTIPAGRTSQLTLPIKAGKSSEHDFSVVLQLSDGREIRSQSVNLLYYLPRWYHNLGN